MKRKAFVISETRLFCYKNVTQNNAKILALFLLKHNNTFFFGWVIGRKLFETFLLEVSKQKSFKV